MTVAPPPIPPLSGLAKNFLSESEETNLVNVLGPIPMNLRMTNLVNVLGPIPMNLRMISTTK